MFGYGRLWVWDGWQCLLGDKPNTRSVLNWLVQATGAVLLRLAIVLAARKRGTDNRSDSLRGHDRGTRQ
jgi:hypothetical protein